MKLYFDLGHNGDAPHCYPHWFATTEETLKAFIDKHHAKGFYAYSYEQNKIRGSVQEVEIDDKRWNKIQKQNYFFLWLSFESVRAPQIIALSDNLTDLAKQVSHVYKHKITSNALKTQYMVKPKFEICEQLKYPVVPEDNVKCIKSIY